jgi:prepilin-type N-terminal cleavage/methylation domain-containing protein
MKLHRKAGFTIVEVLIVLVVTSLLIIGAFVYSSRAQADARDDRRAADIASIATLIDRYYLEHGEYPASSASSGGWSSTSDGTWTYLENQLQPYLSGSQLAPDPASTTGTTARSGGLAYDYYANSGTYCGKAVRQMYILVYRYERRAQNDTLIGGCSTNPLLYSGASNYRVARDNT